MSEGSQIRGYGAGYSHERIVTKTILWKLEEEQENGYLYTYNVADFNPWSSRNISDGERENNKRRDVEQRKPSLDEQKRWLEEIHHTGRSSGNNGV